MRLAEEAIRARIGAQVHFKRSHLIANQSEWDTLHGAVTRAYEGVIEAEKHAA